MQGFNQGFPQQGFPNQGFNQGFPGQQPHNPHQHHHDKHKPTHHVIGAKLLTDQVLQSGQTLQAPHHTYFLSLQHDGNLVLYSSTHHVSANAIWASGTNGKGHGPYHLRMQDDGNLVIYDSQNHAIWASDTHHKGAQGHFLQVQDDGNAVIYDGDFKPIWATNTNRGKEVIGDRLKTDEALHTGSCLKANGQSYYLKLQEDGNLVIYSSSHHDPSNAIWSTGTHGKGQGPHVLRMQADGNLVLYDAHGKPTWASDTYQKGAHGHFLCMQEDGNLVVYDGHSKPVWASNTNRS